MLVMGRFGNGNLGGCGIGFKREGLFSGECCSLFCRSSQSSGAGRRHSQDPNGASYLTSRLVLRFRGSGCGFGSFRSSLAGRWCCRRRFGAGKGHDSAEFQGGGAIVVFCLCWWIRFGLEVLGEAWGLQ
ncbi:hypothetical protein M758_4G159500 [Ceratodon purpureus]|uniref:Uncharacterized protein n=1 Tax=Ceratodon purpureus TaxID=3225 RepID=A0A8T0IA07_CERPU|nr:hypothetical protein KC19_4G158900 [Ceratodon purpureus]KAG0619715.1 hypothetical protein M758_4G159500 [Ceratodon purpureus]